MISRLKNNNMDYEIWREEVDHIMKTGTPEQVERCQNIASDDGVFFTPKSLVKMIVNVIEPKSGISCLLIFRRGWIQK